MGSGPMSFSSTWSSLAFLQTFCTMDHVPSPLHTSFPLLQNVQTEKTGQKHRPAPPKDGLPPATSPQSPSFCLNVSCNEELTSDPRKCFLEVRFIPDTIKLIEENSGRTLFDINCGKIFFDPCPNENKNKQMDLNKLKSFCTAKETIKTTKRQCSEWEKTFANGETDKGLISKIYK